MTHHLSIVRLDLAQLVHELELVDADVAAAISGGEVLPVRTDPDATHSVALVVQRVLVINPVDTSSSLLVFKLRMVR